MYMYLIFLDNQEIDHVSYVHQAFEAASLSYFLEILQSNVLNDFDVSYEIKFQLPSLTWCVYLRLSFIYLSNNVVVLFH